MAKAKPKKWSNLKGTYPAADPQGSADGDWFTNFVKPALQKHEALEIGELQDLLMKHKARKAEREKRISEEDNAIIKAAELLLLKAYAKAKIESSRDAAGRLFTASDEPYFKILDPEKVDKWIDEQGYADMRRVDPNSLKALFRKHLEAGTDIPDGVDISVATLLKSPKP